jgi:hypothetical protein
MAVTLPFESTDATLGSELVQERALYVAPSGLTVATRVIDSPLVKVSDSLSSVTDVTGSGFLLTVTMHVDVLPPAFAMMPARPSETPVTKPVLETVATSLLEDDHVML